MGRVSALRVRNYRSIREQLVVKFPSSGPLVLVGENNAGKSNIVRGLELLLGESWPGNREPEDHEFFGRETDGDPIELEASVEGVDKGGNPVHSFGWRYPNGDDRPYFMNVGGIENGFVSNAIREQCFCIVLSADRRLSYQLSYASQWTLLSKVMKGFHRSLTSDQHRVETLKQAFQDVQAEFLTVPEFSEFAQSLSDHVKVMSSTLAYELQIDFSAYDPSNFFHALRVLPAQNGEPRSFDELGTGQQQVLALAFAYAYATAFHGQQGDIVLVVEEPEAHMHPLAQRWLASHIRQLTAEGLQVVITTHSPAFLDILNLEGTVLVRKIEDATVARQLSKTELAQFCGDHAAEKATADNILEFYAVAATEEILSGFFAKKVFLVEGPTESLALPTYLRRLGLDTAKEGIAVISTQGVGSLAKWWRLFTAYEIPTYVAFDNDEGDDKDGGKRTELLTTLGVDQANIPGLLTATGLTVEAGFAVFGKDFETSLREAFGEAYQALESEARELFSLPAGSAKPLKARYVAERIAIPDVSPAADALGQLRDALEAL